MEKSDSERNCNSAKMFSQSMQIALELPPSAAALVPKCFRIRIVPVNVLRDTLGKGTRPLLHDVFRASASSDGVGPGAQRALPPSEHQTESLSSQWPREHTKSKDACSPPSAENKHALYISLRKQPSPSLGRATARKEHRKNSILLVA